MPAAAAPRLRSPEAFKREDDRVHDPTGHIAVSQTGAPHARWPDLLRLAAHTHATRLESTTAGRFWSRLLEIEFVDRAVALAAKAVVSFFPLLIVVAALSPPASPDLHRGHDGRQVRRQR